MKDKEAKIQIKRVRALQKKWHDIIGLRQWRIDYIYSDQDHPSGQGSYSPELSHNWVVPMATNCDPYYLKGSIVFYLPNLVELSDDELEEGYGHELMHIMLSLMRTDKKSKEEEQVATKLALAFIWVSEHFEKQGRVKLTKEVKRVK